MGKFKKGFLLGGILGAGLVWLNTTKKGREMKDKMLDHAAIVYGDIKDQVLNSKTLKKMNKQKYAAMVHDMVDRYSKENGIAGKTKDMIEKLVKGQWANLQKEIKKRSK